MPKYPRYQDYVIKDGRFIGEFEEMYKDYEDPWEQSTREEKLSYKAIVIFLLKKYNIKRIIEIGSGFGHFTSEIHKLGINVLGIDISETAIKKAKLKYPQCDFKCGDILDFDIYNDFLPDCIIFSEVTWYILEKLNNFLSFYKNWNKNQGGGGYIYSIYWQCIQRVSRNMALNIFLTSREY